MKSAYHNLFEQGAIAVEPGMRRRLMMLSHQDQGFIGNRKKLTKVFVLLKIALMQLSDLINDKLQAQGQGHICRPFGAVPIDNPSPSQTHDLYKDKEGRNLKFLTSNDIKTALLRRKRMVAESVQMTIRQERNDLQNTVTESVLKESLEVIYPFKKNISKIENNYERKAMEAIYESLRESFLAECKR